MGGESHTAERWTESKVLLADRDDMLSSDRQDEGYTGSVHGIVAFEDTSYLASSTVHPETRS